MSDAGRRRTPAELSAQLQDQLGFLRRSSEAYDLGHHEEAKRLAVTVRVLVHDTASSASLLGLLDVKARLQFLDEAGPIAAGNMMPTWGLFRLVLSAGPEGARGRWIPKLGDLPQPARWRTFAAWWEDPVSRLPAASIELSRRDYVLALANREGGAHVDPVMDRLYRAIAHEPGLPTVVISNGVPTGPPEVDPTFAAVRQIAHELLASLASQPD